MVVVSWFYLHSLYTDPSIKNPLQEIERIFFLFLLSARSRYCWNDSTIFLKRNKAMPKWVCFQWNISHSQNHNMGGSRKTQPELSCLCIWILTLFSKKFTPPLIWHLALFLLPRDWLCIYFQQGWVNEETEQVYLVWLGYVFCWKENTL